MARHEKDRLQQKDGSKEKEVLLLFNKAVWF